MKTNIVSILLLFSFFTFISIDIQAADTDDPSWIEFISEGTIENIKNDLSTNPNINEKQNDLGWTVLHAAVSFRRIDVVEALVGLKADLNVKDNSGKTPLMIAVETGQASAVELLIENGANVNIADNNGENPLSIAQKIKLSKIENVLKENNATLPTQDSPQGRGNFQGRGNMQQGFPGGMPGQRRGERVNMQPEQDMPTPDMSVNIIDVETEQDEVGSGELDPNEVQERIKKYPGLTEQILDVADGSKTSLSHWRRIDRDNRTSLISAIRRQYEDEVDFIANIATAEKATKTAGLAKDLRKSRRETFIDINNEVKAADTPARTTSTRRTASRTTTSRVNRRSGSSTVTDTRTQEQEDQYSPEVQGEIDDWVRADVQEINGRMTLMASVNDVLVSEIKMIKEAAVEEKAEKTIAAIDGLLIARKMGFDEVNKELQKIEEEQQQEMIEMQDRSTSEDAPEAGDSSARGMRRRQ